MGPVRVAALGVAGVLTLCLVCSVGAALAQRAGLIPEAKEEERKERDEPEDKRLDAWVTSQQLVEDRLKAPDTADWGSVLDGTFQDPEKRCRKSGKTYRCSGWVKAQNALGVPLKIRWSTELVDRGSRWKIVDVTVEE